MTERTSGLLGCKLCGAIILGDEVRLHQRIHRSAPDLLAALEAIMGDSDVTEVMNVAHWEAADAAIARAYGTEESTNA